MVDCRLTPEPNDAVDFFHAVVPTRYCDFVLLDKDWAAHVERARKRLSDAGGDQAIATVFSKQAGIQSLVAALEGA
jgi:hypothetical protein